MFRDVKLKWEDKEYKITPTMELLIRIEDTVSIPNLAARITKGDIPLSHISFVIASFLQYGGCMVSTEEVYKEIATSEDDQIAVKLMIPVFNAIEPEVKNEKAPLKTKKASKKKK